MASPKMKEIMAAKNALASLGWNPVAKDDPSDQSRGARRGRLEIERKKVKRSMTTQSLLKK